MNYSVELWNNHNKAQSTLHFHLQGLKDIISIYNEQYNIQQNYALFLKKTHSSKNKITVFESLYKGYSSFKGEMLNQYNYLSEFLIGLKDEIIKPLSNLYDTSLKRLNFNIYEMTSIEQTYFSSVEKLEKAKNNFHMFAKNAELSKIKSETYKEKKDKSLSNIIKKEETKMLNSLKNAKENEKIYVELIDKTNNLQDEYIEIKKRNLNEIQEIEEEIAENIKDSFRKFIIYQIAYLKNMEYDIKKKSSIFENINVQKDINNFINNNKTKITQFYKYEYVPYVSELENNILKEQKMYSENTINNVKLFMSNIFSKERPNEINPNSDYNKNKIISDEIKQIINKIFNNNEKISNNDKELENKLLLLKKTRRQLLKEINNYCLNNPNSSLLNEISFDNVYNLLKEALKILQIEKDYESAKLILNFATTFYQICGQKEKKKLFIQNKLIDEKIFQSYDFWKELVKYTIIEEMFNQKSFNLFYNNKENEEKNKLRIKEIVISKINIYLNHMIDFKCKQDFMKKLIQEFKEYYELSDDDTEKLKNKYNEYKQKIENIARNEEIREEANANVNDDNLGNLNINEINENPNNEEEKKSNSTEENSQL